jgi:hypothetical protein
MKSRREKMDTIRKRIEDNQEEMKITVNAIQQKTVRKQ